MRNHVLRHVAWLPLLCLVNCSATSDSSEGFSPPSSPSQPPPTGQRWEDVDVTDACGRTTTAWVLVDEVCGGTNREDYLEGFRVPMFRDGALVGEYLHTVDATHLWVLDSSNPASPGRKALVAGLGQPLAVESRGTDLLIASGADGLVIVDVSNPETPRRRGKVLLPGMALNVHIDGDVAYVAMGDAGVGIVDLSSMPPRLTAAIKVPGFAASVTTKGAYAFIAACSTFLILDRATNVIVGEVWHPNAFRNGVLVAPAKDVEVVDGIAYVAAGRYGAVAVDVSTPSQPILLGNCTDLIDQAFYVSGVKAQGEHLYLAAGEWGVKQVSIAMPACRTMSAPVLPDPPPEQSGECSTDPPWQLLPWENLWAPPPPARDPVQVLPLPSMVFAFGDARRVGIRAVDIRDTSTPDLPLIGRYDEPRRVVSLATSSGKVLVLGPDGGVFERDDTSFLSRVNYIDAAQSGRQGRILPDGRVAILTEENGAYSLVVDEVEIPLDSSSHGIESLAVRGSTILIPASDGIHEVDVSKPSMPVVYTPWFRNAQTPAVVAVGGEWTYLSAAEWTETLQGRDGHNYALSPHGLFDEYDILDVGAWQSGMPHRLLVALDHGLVEVVSFAGRTRLVLHRDGTHYVGLPNRTYMGVAAEGNHAYLVAQDRARYRSDLLTIGLTEDGPVVLSTMVFTGTAMGVAVDGDRLYVADADAGVRVFDLASGAPMQLGIVVPSEVP